MTGSGVPRKLPRSLAAALSQSGGNRPAAGQEWWGGWGSNPGPADYEKHARPQRMLDLHQRLASMPRMQTWHWPAVAVITTIAANGHTPRARPLIATV